MNSSQSIKRWIKLLTENNISFTKTISGNEIIVNNLIKINHNGEKHWTIRIPGTAKDGMRFDFDVNITVDRVSNLIIINDVLAIKI